MKAAMDSVEHVSYGSVINELYIYDYIYILHEKVTILIEVVVFGKEYL